MALTKTQTVVIQWLANGESGMSSKAMALYLGFGVIGDDAGRSHPLDPSDFNRCVKLLRKAPGLVKKLPDLAKLSPQWKRLAAAWSKLEASLESEVGPDWSANRSAAAPLTYAMMKKILDGAPKQKK